MKTIKINEATHEKLSIIRAQAHLRTLSETIDWLIDYKENVILVHKEAIKNAK